MPDTTFHDGQDAGQPVTELNDTTTARIQELCTQLADIGERIGDVSIELIRDALENGADRPAADRTLARARRSVDKAAALLDKLTETHGR